MQVFVYSHTGRPEARSSALSMGESSSDEPAAGAPLRQYTYSFGSSALEPSTLKRMRPLSGLLRAVTLALAREQKSSCKE
ncbi:jg1504 [Pararge aegeria aegeria]|uniref:Jg1504 protein n=1 Tax=Pararge aegeria aegeria TaxID=348720 RepID=A0A8S4QPQ8_9NEOP|nr:jg1504 [Pararge aegeria aegeria]